MQGQVTLINYTGITYQYQVNYLETPMIKTFDDKCVHHLFATVMYFGSLIKFIDNSLIPVLTHALYNIIVHMISRHILYFLSQLLYILA